MIMQYLKKLISKYIEPASKQKKEEAPVFHITKTMAAKSDFEVTELSYEEYAKYTSQERRHVSQAVLYDRRNLSGVIHDNHHIPV